MNFTTARRPLSVFAWMLFGLSGSACASAGPSPAEIAAREARLRDLDARRATLAANAQARRQRGEAPPELPPIGDPGHPVANCFVRGAPPPPEGAVLRTGFGSFICANAEGAKSILSYRAWYCVGEADTCVLGTWENGAPTFGRVVTKNEITNLGDGMVFEIRPATRPR